MIGSQLVIQTLARRGVTTIFSLSGNQIMPLYDACIDAGIRIVHVRHEAAAVFMADAWSQVTGQVGVAMLTAAPGISNGIGPLYSALQSESSVLLISGDSPLSDDDCGAFQELDQAAMTTPLTKHSERVTAIQDLSDAIDQAISTALAPRTGPVHLALPFDLLTQESGINALPAASSAPAAWPVDIAAVKTLASLLAGAQRPICLTGPGEARGVRRAQWRQWSEALSVPSIVLESPRGLRDPSQGCIGEVIAQADLVLLAGKRLDYTLRFGKPPAFEARAKVVVIDSDPTQLARAARLLGDRLALSIEGNVAQVLAAATDAGLPGNDRSAWVDRVASARADRTLVNHTSAPNRIDPKVLCEAVDKALATSEEPILICDGGEFGQWAQAYCSAPTRIINGMSGAIGGSICYAIAAKIARPNATVVALMGDGTIGFHFAEFETAAREQAPFVAVVGNDLRWNAEHVIQLNTYGPDRMIGCGLSDARYEDAAAALGGAGYAVTEAHQLDGVLREAIDAKLPTCVNVPIDGLPAPTFGRNGAVPASH